MGNNIEIKKCRYCEVSGVSCKPTPNGKKRDRHDGHQTLADQTPSIAKCLKKTFGVKVEDVIGEDGVIPPKGQINVGKN